MDLHFGLSIAHDRDMPRLATYDRRALADLAAQRERVLTHRELRQLGVPTSTITSRIAPEGPWQRMLPGVVLMHRGTPTERERLLAGAAYAGPASVITGVHALRHLGVTNVSVPLPIRILIPAGLHRASMLFVAVERTHRLPDPEVRRGLRFAPIPRAVVDAARFTNRLDEVRDLFAAPVQQGYCTVGRLQEEVYHAARQRTALSRQALREVAEGIRSVAEARARECYARHGVPQPLWNVRLRAAGGEVVARPDGYWPEQRAVLEIDSMLWHLTPAAYRRTQARQRFYARLGLLALPVAPSFVLDDEAAFVSETWEILAQGAQLPPSLLTYSAA